jgi:3-oxoacyl-[acyl-carrier protein] reductase/meso-butanediol dehydrogenase/(S,S)-butanediol dehydrogenase/diacetyl reductase
MQKSVVITGGNRGIGYNITKVFVDAGYHVVVGARQDLKLEEELGAHVKFISVDVRNESDHMKLVNAAVEETGTLDVYINNAGYSEWRPISEIDDDFLGDILSTNLMGAFWGCKAAASVMKESNNIINISSLAGKRGSTNNSAYCASKFGMNGLTQSLAKELGPRGIRVNALCPVLIPTDGLIEALKNPFSPANGEPEKFISNFKTANAALGRLPTGEEVAEMCKLIVSESASSITGQCINVDCGVFPQ